MPFPVPGGFWSRVMPSHPQCTPFIFKHAISFNSLPKYWFASWVIFATTKCWYLSKPLVAFNYAKLTFFPSYVFWWRRVAFGQPRTQTPSEPENSNSDCREPEGRKGASWSDKQKFFSCTRRARQIYTKQQNKSILPFKKVWTKHKC